MNRDQRVLLVWVVPCLVLLLTIFSSLQVKQSLEEEAVRRFSFACDQATLKIDDRLNTYAMILRGGAALFAASDSVSRRDWRTYVDTLRASEDVPGVQGIGFTQVIRPEELASHIARIRSEGFPEYSVRPPGKRDLYTSIIYLEPFRDRNLRAFGFDMFSEPVRRAAMEQARDTGNAALSGKVELVQETGKDVQAGTLMYVPVYRQGAPLDSVEQRRAALLGWAYSPYRMNDLMSGIISDWTKSAGNTVDLHIYDGPAASPGSLMFDNKPGAPANTHSLFHTQRTIQFNNGAQWLLEFDSLDGTSAINYASAWATLVGGLAISGLLFWLMLSIVNTRANAKRIAESLTEENSQLNRRLSLAADSAGIGVWDYLVAEDKLTWDKWMYALYGLREEDFSGAYAAWRNGLHADDKERGDREIEQALRGEKEFDTEFRVVWPSGEVRHIKAAAHVLRDEAGQPLRMIGVNYDITERKLLECELKKGREVLRQILDSTAEAIYGIDLNGRCTFCNRACLEMLGYDSQEDLLGRDMHDDIHHSLADGSPFPVRDCRIFRAFQVGKCAHVDDEVLWRKDGRSFPAEYWSYPQSIDGKIVGAVVTFLDVSQRKLAEQTLRQAIETAERASYAKSQFLATMSHEIRTPMNGIIGMTDLVLETRLSDEQRDYLNIVKASAESLLGIINEILDFSKIEAGKMEMERISFDLHRLCASIMKTLSVRAAEKSLELVANLADDVPRQMLGDPGRIRQILLNLLSNAIKFTDRGEVEVAVAVKGRAGNDICIEFSVRDTGIGISQGKQRFIFEPFTQEDSSTTRRFGGTGLGLTVSCRLAELMGGRIWLESQPGQGSTFHVLIPLAIDTSVKPYVVNGHDLRQKRVLLVDDNRTNQTLLGRMTRHWGMDVSEAKSGAEALQMLKDESLPAFDLLLVDHDMPEMDGFELVFMIKSDPRLQPLKIIMLSSSARPGQAARCQELGINAYLTKPVPQHELLESIETVMGGAPTAGAHGREPVTRSSSPAEKPALKLLVAEDNAVNQKLISALLGKLGHSVTLAKDGQEAVDRYKEGVFDLVLMDIQMPVMGGLEALCHIKDWDAQQSPPRHTPVFALTAAALPEEREAGLRAGMAGYLTKPINRKELLDALDGLGALHTEAAQVLPKVGFDYSAALAGCDPEILEIVSPVFLKHARQGLAAVESALLAADWPRLQREAHTQKGLVGNFAAQPLRELLLSIEQGARLAKVDPECLIRLRCEWQKLCSAIEASQHAQVIDGS